MSGGENLTETQARPTTCQQFTNLPIELTIYLNIRYLLGIISEVVEHFIATVMTSNMEAILFSHVI